MCSFAKILLTIIIISGFIFVIFAAKRNNVCTTFVGYGDIDNHPSCFHDPDTDLEDPEDMLRNHVERFEKYNVTTPDGYILIVYRIPSNVSKGVVLLTHPLSADAIVYIASANSSLAYSLHEAGYDVWLPSYRGTEISNKHVKFKNNSFEYFDFDFHDMVVYDTRIWVNLIKEKTNRSDIVYIGHSLSGGMGVLYGSLFPEEAAASLKVAIVMAPTVTLNHINLQIINNTQLQHLVIKLVKEMNVGSMYDNLLVKALRFMSRNYPYNQLAELLICLFSGWTPGQFDPVIMGSIMKRMPRGVAMKICYHFWQMITSGRYQQFDYGEEENLKRYGQKLPPLYEVEKIKLPLHIIYTTDDFLITPEDIEDLWERLPKEAKIYGKRKISGMNHVDFIAGKDRVAVINEPVIQFIESLFT